MRRKRRSKRFGVRFFCELALLLSLTLTCFVAFDLLSGSGLAGAVAAFILFAALMISPLTRHVSRGVFSARRSRSEGWENYFSD